MQVSLVRIQYIRSLFLLKLRESFMDWRWWRNGCLGLVEENDICVPGCWEISESPTNEYWVKEKENSTKTPLRITVGRKEVRLTGSNSGSPPSLRALPPTPPHLPTPWTPPPPIVNPSITQTVDFIWRRGTVASEPAKVDGRRCYSQQDTRSSITHLTFFSNTRQMN